MNLDPFKYLNDSLYLYFIDIKFIIHKCTYNYIYIFFKLRALPCDWKHINNYNREIVK